MSTAHAAGVPRLTWLPAALALGLLVLPVVALVVRADWGTLPSDVSSPAARQALALSLGTSLAATACCLVLGVPLALVLARTTGRAADVLRALVTLPLVLPPTVGGIALLHLLGRRGLVGRSLEAWFGVTIPFSTAAVVIAQVFVAMPFLVLGLEGALRTAGTRYEVVAATLGAGRWTTLRRVTLPLAASGLLAGTVLCFARALGEFGATALFAGNAPGVTQTMPLAIYAAFNGAGVTQGTAVALSLLLVVAAVAVLLVARAWRPGVTGRDVHGRGPELERDHDVPAGGADSARDGRGSPVPSVGVAAVGVAAVGVPARGGRVPGGGSVPGRGRVPTGPAAAPRALAADVHARRGTFELTAALTVEPGTVTAVLGPNGAGKSTLLALLAGTLAVDRGHVAVGDRVLTQVTPGRRTVQVPPERRAVGLLGQDPLVFPHLDALDGVAFGPRAAGRSAADARSEAAAWLAAVGLAGLGRRRPDALSGGQRQRVALARALAARPDALLLDEPFAQLDVRTAAELRDLVREHVRAAGIPTVLVSHDVVDVLSLADHVVVLHDGAVVETGEPVTVLTDPVHPFTATLADLNLLRATLDTGSGPALVRSRSLCAHLPVSALARWVGTASPGVSFSTRSRLQLVFSPGDVAIGSAAGGPAAGGAAAGGRAGGDRLVWDAVVVDVERGPRGVRVRTTDDVLVDVAAARAVTLDLRPGSPVQLSVAAADVRVRPA